MTTEDRQHKEMRPIFPVKARSADTDMEADQNQQPLAQAIEEGATDYTSGIRRLAPPSPVVCFLVICLFLSSLPLVVFKIPCHPQFPFATLPSLITRSLATYLGTVAITC